MEQGGTGRTVHEQHARTTPVRPRVPARQRAPAGRCPCPGLPGSGCLRAGRIDGRTVPPCSGSLLGRSAWGALAGRGFAFRFRSIGSERLFPSYGDHGPRVLLLSYVSAPVSPTIADSFGIAFGCKRARPRPVAPSPRPSPAVRDGGASPHRCRSLICAMILACLRDLRHSTRGCTRRSVC
jgi:hypothetical protein